VRRKVLFALGERGSVKAAPAMLERLSDDAEDPFVRAAAASALSRICATMALPTLVELAKPFALLGSTDAERVVARAALQASVQISSGAVPAELRGFLSPDAPPWVRRTMAQLPKTSQCGKRAEPKPASR
jgi:HEAT repeat protein